MTPEAAGGSPRVAVGLVGMGVVGGTLGAALEQAGLTVRGYDPYLGIGGVEDLAGCRVVFLCVPTPAGRNGGHDPSAVYSAASAVEPHLEAGTVVAVKSTAPPGTCDRLAARFPRIQFASVPEFLVATRPHETLTNPDRIVIGARSPEVGALLAELMRLVAPQAPIVFLSPVEAELVKLCSNAMLAAKVSMANELSEVCRRFGVAWPAVQAVVGMDRRIGPDHLTVTPERGFGGECLPKDLDGLIAEAAAAGYRPLLLQAIAEFNRRIRLGASLGRLGTAASGNGQGEGLPAGGEEEPAGGGGDGFVDADLERRV